MAQLVKTPPAVQETACNTGDDGSIPRVRKIPWRKKWLATLVFLPGKSHGQRNLVGYGPWGLKESDMTEGLIDHAHAYRIYKKKKIQ